MAVAGRLRNSSHVTSLMILCPICGTQVPSRCYQIHRDGCRKGVSDPLQMCPYDGRHRFCAEELKFHLNTCPSRNCLVKTDSNGNVTQSHLLSDEPILISKDQQFQRRTLAFESRESVKLPNDLSEAQLTQLTSTCHVCLTKVQKADSKAKCLWCSRAVPNQFDSLLQHSLSRHIRLGRYTCRYCRFDSLTVDQIVIHLSEVHSIDTKSAKLNFTDRFNNNQSAAMVIGRLFGQSHVGRANLNSETDEDMLMRSQLEFELEMASGAEPSCPPPLTAEQIRLGQKKSKRGAKPPLFHGNKRTKN